jgi:hypothetical protein
MAIDEGNHSRARISRSPKKPFYRTLWGQVLIGVAIGIVLGYVRPHAGVAMKPLGDAFIRLITMVITLVVFCTIVSGIAGMGDMKKVGRVGGKALLYFEIVSTLALLIGMLVGNVVKPGAGFNVNPQTLDAKAVAGYATLAKSQSVTDFLINLIPNTVVSAFSTGNMLQVVLVAVLFGFALSMMGKRCKPLADAIDWRFRSHGVHYRPVWPGIPWPAGQADRDVLDYEHFVCVDCDGDHLVGGRLRDYPIPQLYQGRNCVVLVAEFIGTGAPHIDGEDGEPGLLEIARRSRGANGLHF